MSFPLGNPFKINARAPGGTPGFGPGPAVPGMDPNAINAALSPYGVSEPQSFQQPGPAENTSWGQTHPNMAMGIDNALIAVGGMGPTGDTAGENISNTVRGVMGIQSYRQQAMANQAMVPFQLAKEVGGLQAQQSYMKMQEAMAGYYGDRGRAALEKNADARANQGVRLQIEAMKEPQVMADPITGKQGVGFFQARPDANGAYNGDGEYVINPNVDVDTFKQEHHVGQLSKLFPGADGQAIMFGMANELGGDVRNIPADPLSWGPKERNAYLKSFGHIKMLSGDASRGAMLDRQVDTENNTAFIKYDNDLTNSFQASKPSKEQLDSAANRAYMSYTGDPSKRIGSMDQAREAMLNAWKSQNAKARLNLYTEHATWMHMTPTEQAQYRNSYEYYHQVQNGQGAPTPAPTSTPSASALPNPTPGATAAPAGQSLQDTLQQLHGLLSKPKV